MTEGFITPAEFQDEMNRLAEDDDTEMRHAFADEMMCKILCQFGYEIGVGLFKKMEKWYA